MKRAILAIVIGAALATMAVAIMYIGFVFPEIAWSFVHAVLAVACATFLLFVLYTLGDIVLEALGK